jgi:hypothetical protein
MKEAKTCVCVGGGGWVEVGSMNPTPWATCWSPRCVPWQGDNCFGLRLLVAAAAAQYKVARSMVPGYFILPSPTRFIRTQVDKVQHLVVLEGPVELANCPWCVPWLCIAIACTLLVLGFEGSRPTGQV